MKIRLLAVAVATSLLASVSGCTNSISNIRANTKAIEANAAASTELIDKQMKKVDEVEPGVRIIDNVQFVSTDSIALPKVSDPVLKCQILTGRVTPYSVAALAQLITTTCNIPVRLTADAQAYLNGAYDKAIAQAGNTSPTATTNPVSSAPGNLAVPQTVIAPPALPNGSATTFGLGASASSLDNGYQRDRLELTGTMELQPLLNTIAARTGLSYRFEDGVVTLFYLDTRTYRIFAIPSDMTFDTSVQSGDEGTSSVSSDTTGSSGGGGGGAGGSGTTNQNTTVKLKSSILADLESTVRSMLTPGVGRIALSPSMATITVTDTVDTLNKVGPYLDDQNKLASLQALVTVKILTVDFNDVDELGANLQAVYTMLSKNYQVKITNGFQGDPSATTAGVNILQGNGKWGTSSAVIDALSQIAHVTTAYDQPLTTLNMRPVPIKNVDVDDYVKSVTVEQLGTTSGGLSTQTNVSSLVTGLNMTILPYITPDGNTIYLQFSMDLTGKKPFENYTTADGNQLKLRHKTGSQVSNSVKIGNGQTLLLAGYDATQNNSAKSGTGNPNFALFGGGVNATRAKRAYVILITPRVQG